MKLRNFLSCWSVAALLWQGVSLAAPAAKPHARTSANAPHPAASPAPAAPAGPRTWALLVGVSKYQSPQIASLHFPAIDVTAVRDALVDPRLGGVPNDQVRLLTDDQATASNINSAVEDFLKPNVKPGDHVIVFLAGHGVAKGVGLDAKSFLLPTDVKGLTTASLEASAVDLKNLSSQLGDLPASQFVVFVDACREDPTPGRGVKGNTMSDIFSRGVEIQPHDDSHPATAVTFFACGIGERAYEDPTYQHGVFTYWILQGIKDGPVPAHDGSLDMSRLSTYVKQHVGDWAKQASSSGDFDIEQSPQVVSSEVADPVVLMRVKRPVTADPIAAAAPSVTVATFPEGAQVFINEQKMGAGTVTGAVPSSGTYTVRVEAPGYQPVARSVKVLDGYEDQIMVQLKPEGAPAARAVTASAADGGPGGGGDLYARARKAEAQGDWEIAMAGYDSARQADPSLAPAYLRLADLQAHRGQGHEAIATLVDLVNKTTPTCDDYCQLALIAAQVAEKEKTPAPPPAKKKRRHDDSGPPAPDMDSGPIRVPATADEAAALSRRAANEAVKLGPSAAEAQAALGFALVATDRLPFGPPGANQTAALAAFGKAVFLDDKDAANLYALGYGIRDYSLFKPEDMRQSELNRAIEKLHQALALRPNYYEAHRELAYCYNLLGDTNNAIKEYDLANANRGAATDKDEVAGEDVALCGLHQKRAATETGDKKDGDQQASAGYMDDAKDTTPDLTKALSMLQTCGVSGSLVSYLPPNVQAIVNYKETINNAISSKVPGIGGGGFHLPF